MPVPTPSPITEAFGVNAGVTFVNYPIPVASQIGIVDGAASFNDGFPPLNFTKVELGGVPPSGADMNGLLKMITAYCAMLQAGQPIKYNAAVQTAIGGYALGAVLQKAADTNATWTSVAANNMTNPDTGGAGWLSSIPLYFADATLLGAVNDYVLPGPSDYTLDVDTTAGAVNITGFVAQRANQTLYVTNTGANPLVLDALNAGSAVAHRLRTVGDFNLSQYGSLTIRYSAGVGKWLVV